MVAATWQTLERESSARTAVVAVDVVVDVGAGGDDDDDGKEGTLWSA